MAYRILPLLQLPQYIQVFGMGDGLKFPLAFFTRKKNISLEIPAIKNPIIVRPGTSDVQVFFAVLVRREYDLSHDIQPDFDAKLIIDGGANVGYTSLFFANKYPSAEILAIEPEESNFKMLVENTCAYPNVKPIRGAIWYRKTALRIKNLTEDDKWLFQIEETDERASGLKAIVIADLLRTSGHDTIDILKLNIEGAEKDVFSQNTSDWLGHVRVLIVEIHDPLKSGCGESLDSATRSHSFHRSNKGQYIVLINQKERDLKGNG